MYYNRIGTSEIYSPQGDFVGTIEDEDLRTRALSGLNLGTDYDDVVTENELLSDQIEVLRDKIKALTPAVVTAK